MGHEAPESAAVTPLIWIGHDIAPGRFWWRSNMQFSSENPTSELIVNRQACFDMACGGKASAEKQWRSFMLYVAHLRVSGGL